MLNGSIPSDLKPGLEYFWWKGQRIMTTMGGASGSILDGPYREYHVNGQLKIQGQLRKGLRHGEWREWDADGKLRTITRWRRGHLRTKRMAMGGNGITEEKLKRRAKDAATKEKKETEPEKPRKGALKKNKKDGDERLRETPKKKRPEDPRS